MSQTIHSEPTTDWRAGLPVLHGRAIQLREIRPADAPALFAHLATEEVARFISPPPADVSGFERFIAWAIRQRAAGTNVCFVITQEDDVAIGLIQVRALNLGFATAEWGFALGSAYWGSGIFMESAELVLEFAFGTLGVHRLEARAVVQNGRGNGALRKLCAVQEGVLRASFRRNGCDLDQILWTILDEEWRDRWLTRRFPAHFARTFGTPEDIRASLFAQSA